MRIVMRSEAEMYQLILDVARRDDRIRAVYMNGSRANPKVKKDIFQDYDIVYVVTEIGSFLEEKNWISVFGELIISQEPDRIDKMLGKSVDFSKGYTYLMQFTDGNRIDLHLEPLEGLKEIYGRDKLTIPLLDKDNYLPVIPEPVDEDYWVKKPSYEEYYSHCNEFWWVAPYCAKGLWRNETLYAAEMLNNCIRPELLNLLSWYVGTQTDFKVSVGKANKYLKEYLPQQFWNRLMQTFNMGDNQSIWNALITICELFEEVAVLLSEFFGYPYNVDEAHRSFNFIKHIRNLPHNATKIY